jgi:sugar phosphate isomerase/epimerase
VNTLAFHGYEFAQILEAIRALGFSYVEPALISSYYAEMEDEYFSDNQAKRLSTLISEQELTVIAMSAHMDLGTEGAFQSFRRRMDFALELGAQYIHTNSATKEKTSVFMRNLEQLFPYAEASGLVITLENPGDGENNIIGTGEDGAVLIQKIDSKNVRLNYDFSNAYSYSKGKIKPEEDFRLALPFSAHLHLKDMRYDGMYWNFVSIGEGITDYKSVFDYLAKHEMDLPMSIELPLRFYRRSDFKIQYNLNSKPPPLSEIHKVLQKSKEFILGNFPHRFD